MGNRWVLVAGLTTLALSLTASAVMVGAVVRQPATVRAEKVQVRTADAGVVVDAEIVLVPHVRATFRSLEGDLRVGDQPADFEVVGLAPGDTLVPDTERTVAVRLALGPATLAAATVQTLRDGALTMTFDGDVHVSVLGVPTSVPVHIERRVEF